MASRKRSNAASKIPPVTKLIKGNDFVAVAVRAPHGSSPHQPTEAEWHLLWAFRACDQMFIRALARGLYEERFNYWKKGQSPLEECTQLETIAEHFGRTVALAGVEHTEKMEFAVNSVADVLPEKCAAQAGDLYLLAEEIAAERHDAESAWQHAGLAAQRFHTAKELSSVERALRKYFEHLPKVPPGDVQLHGGLEDIAGLMASLLQAKLAPKKAVKGGAA